VVFCVQWPESVWVAIGCHIHMGKRQVCLVMRIYWLVSLGRWILLGVEWRRVDHHTVGTDGFLWRGELSRNLAWELIQNFNDGV
jgi:hypothetical protein